MNQSITMLWMFTIYMYQIQRFGALGGFGEEGWNRAKGHITYKESSMADYALK